MKSLFKEIKSFFEPERISHPFEARKTSVRPIEVLPENLKYVKGQAFIHQDTDSGFEADVWTGQTGQRSERMTEADRKLIKERRLKESKYRELKVYWSAHYSAGRVARELRSKKGYGKRTIEKYWSAMNEAERTTTLLLR